jgi:hypothetical protein
MIVSDHIRSVFCLGRSTVPLKHATGGSFAKLATVVISCTGREPAALRHYAHYALSAAFVWKARPRWQI